MLHISNLLDMNELTEMISEKRINKQVHPTLPISIYNYSNRAQFMNKWTNSERVCRGLIVEDFTGTVINRGPAKFMNYGDPKAPEIPLDALTRATRKHDGSLGIGWMYDGHFGIATRGSFTSDQAKHATALLDNQLRYEIQHAATHSRVLHGSTKCWEIIFPENRIVLDYGDFDGLLELGLVENSSGVFWERPEEIFTTKVITFAEALKLPVPDDEEGYVLDVQPFAQSFHVKLKGETYKILHGLLTNTNSRRIWVQLAARACHEFIEDPKDWANKLTHDPEDFVRVDVTKDIVDTLLTNVPDEFYDWVTKQIDSIEDKVSDLLAQARQLTAQVSMVEGNRERYEIAQSHPLCREILQFAKSGDDSGLIMKAWAIAKPSGDETPFTTEKED